MYSAPCLGAPHTPRQALKTDIGRCGCCTYLFLSKSRFSGMLIEASLFKIFPIRFPERNDFWHCAAAAAVAMLVFLLHGWKPSGMHQSIHEA